MGSYPAGYPRRPREGRDHLASVSRCVSAAGVRFLVILCPPGNWAFLTVGLPDLSPDPDGVSTFRTHKTRSGRAPSIARGRWCSVQADHDHRPAPGVSQRRVPAPHHNLHLCAAPLDEPSTRVQAIRPSDLPLARGRRMDRQPFGFPSSFAPRDYSRRTSRVGTDLIEHGSETSAMASARPPTSRVYSWRATSRRTRGRRSVQDSVAGLVVVTRPRRRRDCRNSISGGAAGVIMQW